MNDGNQGLREALNRSGVGNSGDEDCPADEAIWAAARGELAPEDAQTLIDHAVECAACRISLSIASGIVAESEKERPQGNVVRFPRRMWFPIAAAAAAVLVLAFFAPTWFQQSVPVERFRGDEAADIESLVDASAPLPRDAFVLRWTAGPAGTLYSLTVTREDLTLLHTVEEIEATEYTVPEAALSRLPAGTPVVWRLRATLPDARRVDSVVFRATVR